MHQYTSTQRTLHDFYRESMQLWKHYPSDTIQEHAVRHDATLIEHLGLGLGNNKQHFQVGRALARASEDIVSMFFDPEIRLPYRAVVESLHGVAPSVQHRPQVNRCHSYSCTQCGAPLKFVGHSVKCGYCSTVSHRG